MTDSLIVNLLVIFLLVLANAFFVAAEFALVRVRRSRMDELARGGNRAAVVVRDALGELDRYISATQLGVTLASIGLGIAGEPVMAHQVFEPCLKWVLPGAGENEVSAAGHIIASFFAYVSITYFHVVFGELVPKNIALRYSEQTALYFARPMRLFATVFNSAVLVLNGSSNFLLRRLGIEPAKEHGAGMSEEELLIMLAESKKAGVVTEDEQRMLQAVFKFHDKTVREIMVPRLDVQALDLRAEEPDIRNLLQEGYSRIPVYEGTLDNVKGVVYVKDLLYTLQDPTLIKLVDLLRECMFVPETKPLPMLLRDFQRTRVHMAVVVNEHGDTVGIVTLEDVLEEIVGEIQDEYDSEAPAYQKLADGNYVFDGKTAITVFKDALPAFKLPEGEFDTVAGLIMQLTGRVPREGDTLHSGETHFKVLKREGRRLRKIAVWQDGVSRDSGRLPKVQPERERANADKTA